MLVFWTTRLVFLANTKAGSTSIEMALESLAHLSVQRPAVLRHTSAAQYRHRFAPYLQDAAGQSQPFETLALIREPLDWLGSWYRYRLREGLPIGAEGSDRSFAAFVADYLAGQRGTNGHPGCQADLLADAEGRRLVDHLFRYEEIDRLVTFLEDRLGCEITLPRLNASPRAPVDLPPALDQALRQHLARDFALYEALTPAAA